MTLLLLISHKNILCSYMKLLPLRIEAQSPSVRKLPSWRFLVSKNQLTSHLPNWLKEEVANPVSVSKLQITAWAKLTLTAPRALRFTREHCFMVTSWAASIWNTMGDPRSSPLTGEEFQAAISSFSAVVVSFVKSKAIFSLVLLPQKWRLLVSWGLWDMGQLMQTLKTAEQCAGIICFWWYFLCSWISHYTVLTLKGHRSSQLSGPAS